MQPCQISQGRAAGSGERVFKVGSRVNRPIKNGFGVKKGKKGV
jgi:hypothetical protein